jgi:hypothetical protein
MAGYTGAVIRVLIPVYAKQIKIVISRAGYFEHSHEAKNIFKWRCKDSIDNRVKYFEMFPGSSAGIPCNAPRK